MQYDNITDGIFVRRINRFVAEVDLQDHRETVHVKNTGRCRELLIPGVQVFLTAGNTPNRKTRYDLVAVSKQRSNQEPLLINMDSQIPNAAALEWLQASSCFSPQAVFRREVTCNNSRFDLFVEDGERKVFIEVKGVTLEQNGIAMFPDAPTERGVKHLNELARCIDDGFEAWVFFVIQMQGVSCFTPHDSMHPQFGAALRQAHRAGVKILAMDCLITPDSIKLNAPIPVQL